MHQKEEPTGLEKQLGLFYKQQGCSKILPFHIFQLIINQMKNYPSTSKESRFFLKTLIEICAKNQGLHFNWNTDVERLLICRYPRKITFFTRNDYHAFTHYNKDTLIDIGKLGIFVGQITKGEKYETNRLNALRSKIENIIGKRTIIGFYGQLYFPTLKNREQIRALFNKIFATMGTEKIAILCSGSLLGVSGIVHEEAIRKSIPIMGIIPHSISHLVDKEKFAYLIQEGNDWGDGSFIFGRLPNYLVFTGGGYWSFLEYECAIKHNKSVTLLEFKGVHWCQEFKQINAFKTHNEKTLEKLIKEIRSLI